MRIFGQQVLFLIYLVHILNHTSDPAMMLWMHRITAIFSSLQWIFVYLFHSPTSPLELIVDVAVIACRLRIVHQFWDDTHALLQFKALCHCACGFVWPASQNRLFNTA
jgi:hypothetical protein